MKFLKTISSHKFPAYLFYLLIFSISFQALKPLTITEVNYLTFNSKYYNQAIEVINTNSTTINLTDYFLITRNLTRNAERTNSIREWTTTEQAKFINSSTYIPNFDPNILPGETAVILDNGYLNGFTENYHLNGVKILTTSTGVLGEISFIKEDDILTLTTDLLTTNDQFFLMPSTKGYSINRHTNSQAYTVESQTIGSNNLSNSFTTLAPTGIELVESQQQDIIVGLPQIFFIHCVNNGLTAINCNRTINLTESDLFNFYYTASSGNLNVLDDDDDITINNGISIPLIGYGLSPTTIQLEEINSVFNPLTISVNNFNHPNQDSLFISEIYYHAEDNLSWVEIYLKKSFDGHFNLVSYNSDYAERDSFTFSTSNLEPGWYVLGYHTNNFDATNSWNREIIELDKPLDITTKGVLVVKENNQILEVVHYDKNWLTDPDNSSLQRFNYTDYAFTRNDWGTPEENPLSPNQENIFDFEQFEYPFAVQLESQKVSTAKPHLPVKVNIPGSGNISAVLYDFAGTELGLVWLEDVEREYQKAHNICLKKANLKNGEYFLEIIYEENEQFEISTHTFQVEG